MNIFPLLPKPPPNKRGWPWTAESVVLPSKLLIDMEWPKISIVTPSFNQGQFLEETIRSVLLQNYPNLEYIVIDGGSKDNSTEILKKYSSYISYWISEPDNGQSAAINKGFECATGDIYAWLNSDDVLKPYTLSVVANSFKKKNTYIIVGGNEFIDEKSELIEEILPNNEINIKTLFNWLNLFQFVQPSCFFSNNIWRECGPLDINLHFAMDLDLWFRISSKYDFTIIKEILSSSRIHKSAKTTKNANNSLVETCLVFTRYGGEEYALKHLNDLALRTTWNEYYINKILSIPGVYLIRNILRKLFKSDDKWIDFTVKNNTKD